MGGSRLASGLFSLPYAAKEAISRLFAHHHGLLKMTPTVVLSLIPTVQEGAESGVQSADQPPNPTGGVHIPPV
jgi:hypothetical protein